MNDAWDDMRRAKEDQYFEKENSKLLHRLAEQSHDMKSPATGEPMEKSILMGLEVYRCPKTGGYWITRPQLEQIIERAKEESDADFIHDFLNSLYRGEQA